VPVAKSRLETQYWGRRLSAFCKMVSPSRTHVQKCDRFNPFSKRPVFFQLTGRFGLSGPGSAIASSALPLHLAPRVKLDGNRRNKGSNNSTAAGFMAKCANNAAARIRGAKFFCHALE